MRTWILRLGVGVILFLCAAQGAWAETETQRLYDEGAFLDAARRGEEVGSVAGMVLAARSLIAYGAFLAKPDEQVAVFGRALDLAARVLVQDSDNLEAHLQTVNGLGHVSRAQGHVASHFKGYARTAKKHLKRAKKIAPENPWVHALYGAWHAEIAVHAPRVVAFAYYGASKKKAVRYFERAVVLGSDNPVILAEYGNAILMIDWQRNRDKARELYEKSLEIAPRNAFERLVRARTRRSLEHL